MVDNINLNRIAPLLSSAEHVKQVDRKQRDHQQPPFKGAPKDGDKKKKKKKKKGKEETISEGISSGDGRGLTAHAAKGREKQKKESEPQQTKKIIDIRV